MTDFVSSHANMYLLFSRGYDGHQALLLDTVAKLRSVSTTHLVTTRLDNDDLLHKDFIQTIQKHFDSQSKTVIDFPYGYQLVLKDAETPYVRKKREILNPFTTLIEDIQDAETILRYMHFQWSRHANILTLRKRIWMQTIHEDNVENAEDVGSRVVTDRRILEDFSISFKTPLRNAASTQATRKGSNIRVKSRYLMQTLRIFLRSNFDLGAKKRSR